MSLAIRTSPLPVIIQGGMGVGVSGWRLASAVAHTGQLGVVSGIALDTLMARRLQQGDPGGHLRRALRSFPAPTLAEKILSRYFVNGGIPPGQPFRPTQHIGLSPRRQADELAVVANFAEVFLAKEGHDGRVGINYMEKLQLATPAAIYGAMLAGVDVVLMGAGLPTEIPRLMDALCRHERAEIPVDVAGALAGARYTVSIDPTSVVGRIPYAIDRPQLLAIVSSAILVDYLNRDPATRPDGFVLETPVAGGHSARPRGKLNLSEDGEPVYGTRDELDLARVRAAGLPFWLAGGYATPDRLAEARAAGAAGIQVGTAFALCRESGLDPSLRKQLLEGATDGTLRVRNDPEASPTGFPFKLARLPDTAAEDDVYSARPRLCDLGYLRTPYRKSDGRIGYRCPAEPVDAYVRKGGDAGGARAARCLCNGLTASIGLGQHRADGFVEPPLVTLGQELTFLADLANLGDYTAAHVVDYLLRTDPRG